MVKGFFEKGFRSYFLVLLTGRRNFIPILSAYYLTLPNSNAAEIGLYTGLGFLASFIFNVPAGIIADRFGYKRTLICAKILLIGSSAAFLFSNGFYGFVLWSILSSLGTDALTSWTGSSYFRDLLTEKWRKHEYKEKISTIRADVSLISIGFIVGLPFLTEINMRLPLLAALIIDVVGLLSAISLPHVQKEGGEIKSHETKSLLTLISEIWGTPFVPLAFFTAIIGGCLVGDATFRIPYLISLWYPLVFAGMIMGLSRLVWFIVGRNVITLEKFLTPSRLLIFDIAVFSWYYLIAAILSNPYLIAVGFILGVWYFWGRSEVYNDLLFDHMKDPRYKATLMSLRSQLSSLFQVVIASWIGFLMAISYHMGFAAIGAILLTSLSFIYFFFLRQRIGEIVKA